MLKLGVPENIDKYIKVESSQAHTFHINGFIPTHRDGVGFVYFKKTKEIIKFMKGSE